MLVEIIVGKNTGDVALATALDYVRQIRKTPIVVNDSRGFFANRCVLRYIGEGYQMLLEGVPPAMIENAGRMAGMPVGPLSLNDEIAIDLALKIIKATKPISPAGDFAGREKTFDRDGWRSRDVLAARTARASTTIPRKAKAQRRCGRVSKILRLSISIPIHLMSRN